MSAEWYCNIHGTSQLLSCEKCEIEENDMAHEGCREKLTSLRKEVERLREALEKISNRICDHNTAPCKSHRIADKALSAEGQEGR